MSRIRKEEVRDGYFGDLSPALQSKLMEVHKIIVDNCNSTFKEKNYNSINNTPWAKQMLSEFETAPKDKFHVGSVRVYKSGKRYRCMIQISGHVINNRNNIDEELFHDFIRNVHQDIRAIVKRKFDLHLTCESEHGEHFEGFDVWTSKKVAEDIWKSFEGKKSKTIKEDYNESVIIDNEYIFADMYEMPAMLAEDVNTYNRLLGENANSYLELYHNQDQYSGKIYVDSSKTMSEATVSEFESKCPCLFVDEPNVITLDESFAQKLYNELDNSCEDIHNSWMIQSFNEYNEEQINDAKYKMEADYLAPLVKAAGNTLQFDLLSKVETYIDDEYFAFRFEDDDSASALICTVTVFSHYFNDGTLTKDKLYQLENELAVYRDSLEKALKDNGLAGIITNQGMSIQKFIELISKLSDTEDRWNVELEFYVNLTKEEAAKYIPTETDAKSKFDDAIIAEYNKMIDWIHSPNKYIGKGYGEFGLFMVADLCNCLDISPERINAAIGRNFDPAQNKKAPSNMCEKSWDDPDAGTRADDIIGECYLIEESMSDTFVYSIDQKCIYMLNTEHQICEKFYNSEMTHISKIAKINDDKEYYKNLIQNKVGQFNESANALTDNEAKRTLATLSQSIINDCKDGKCKATQYTMNIYSNIITKSLLDKWAPGYRKLSIVLDFNRQGNTLEFKTPHMDQSFIARFIDGKETLDGFLHRDSEISIKMSPSVLSTMKDKDDAFNFFKAALKYYSTQSSGYADKLYKSYHKLNNEMKKLTQNTKLSGIVSLPLQMLFKFSDVDMTKKDTFKFNLDDINAVNTFIRGIYSNYASPEKEKKEILDGLKKLISSFNESYGDTQFNYLPMEVEKMYEGAYDEKIEMYKEEFISENIDRSWDNHTDHEIRLLQEKTKVKKLKKLPADLVAYISIEAECIKDANDKMMIASYCISKIEIVEWYIELLEVGSKKYIVPHTLTYLQTLRTQLLACYKKIMDVKIVPPSQRPIIDVNYDKLKNK